MCLSVCGRVKTVDLPFASIDIKGIETLVNVELVEEPVKGDYVLVHAGFAIEKIDEEYFNYLDSVLEEMLKEDDEY
ncbi:HypC/HybG/HupF family hydrogenase formation chaperone [Clostridium sp. MSJ-4]|uniref:HypC/HybG/HupF family hydrogenase formation chaperone n=1 Tax=Clostridium simiarum TaxID=2841506 RepID=A0ABS6F6B8_9CLOT|nr:HypC/HybG/HupF family hydrogenase formation chaperone [Clostridium simiarum]MBU5593062.1 HypC/HybG/HupF family hydrogenase formation chaperone [Clostridium simiarum]